MDYSHFSRSRWSAPCCHTGLRDVASSLVLRGETVRVAEVGKFGVWKERKAAVATNKWHCCLAPLKRYAESDLALGTCVHRDASLQAQ